MKIVKPECTLLTEVDENTVLSLLETAGRTCYQSLDRRKDGSAQKLVSAILSSGHESVIEHFNISVLITCDRGVSHEIVRHRLASYSQESTRYCNYDRDKFGHQITYIDISGGIELDRTMAGLSDQQTAQIMEEWMSACEDAQKHYMKLLELGASAQIARSVLNNSTKTSIVMTMNLRSWRHFFLLRCAHDAHPQMRELALPMLALFKKKLPAIFEDIPY